MLSIYAKIILRRLFKLERDRSFFYSWINLGGLTIGFTAFLLIGHYINYETGFDRFYPDHRNMYRLTVERMESGEKTMQSAKTYAGLGEFLKNGLPEVDDYVRVLYEECMFHYEPEDIIFNRQHTFWADGNFADFIGLEILAKGQLELLHTPNQAIISESAAKRFFGPDWKSNNSPVGKTLILNGGVPFMIQGVYRDLPVRSHMQVDFVVSYSTLMALLGEFMNEVMPPEQNFVYTYILLHDNTGIEDIESRIGRLIKEHTGNLADHISFHFFLQPVASIHLNSHLSDELKPNGNQLFILALSLAAILIMIIAWINFVNLSVARAVTRSREVGVRKVVGAGKTNIAIQFTLEVLLQGFIAVLLTMLIAGVAGNWFNQIIGIQQPIFSHENLDLWLIFLAVFLAGGILSSIYPAMILSAVNPIKALKGKNAVSLGNNHFRQGLTMFQFLVSMLLIACTAVIYYQVEAMRKQSLSEDFEKVLVIHSPRTMIGHPERANFFREFRNYFENHTDIHSIASGGCLPGEDFLFHTENVVAEGKETEINWSFDVASIDEQYLPALGIKLIAGRNFEERAGEEDKVILNETALGVLGFLGPEEAIQKFVRIDNSHRYQVVGIMQDTHFRGLRESIKPLILKYGHDYEFGYFPVRIATGNLHQAIRRIESGWKETYPRDPFEYFFLDIFFDRQYSNDKAFGRLFGSFSLLAIFLSGLGLFGLISYATAQKAREIGIRKVMGAGVLSIVKLLTVNMLKLLIVAAIVALPLAYWITGYWLNTFAYRFEPPFWMYLVPLVLLLITSMVAVGGQTMKSALRNPVKAIAEE